MLFDRISPKEISACEQRHRQLNRFQSEREPSRAVLDCPTCFVQQAELVERVRIVKLLANESNNFGAKRRKILECECEDAVKTEWNSDGFERSARESLEQVAWKTCLMFLVE